MLQKRGNSWVRGWCETEAGRGKQCWSSEMNNDLIASRGRALSAKLQLRMRREPNEDIRNCTGRRVSARGLRRDPDWRARFSCPPPPRRGWVGGNSGGMYQTASGIFLDARGEFFHTHHTPMSGRSVAGGRGGLRICRHQASWPHIYHPMSHECQSPKTVSPNRA